MFSVYYSSFAVLHEIFECYLTKIIILPFLLLGIYFAQKCTFLERDASGCAFPGKREDSNNRNFVSRNCSCMNLI